MQLMLTDAVQVTGSTPPAWEPDFANHVISEDKPGLVMGWIVIKHEERDTAFADDLPEPATSNAEFTSSCSTPVQPPTPESLPGLQAHLRSFDDEIFESELNDLFGAERKEELIRRVLSPFEPDAYKSQIVEWEVPCTPHQ